MIVQGFRGTVRDVAQLLAATRPTQSGVFVQLLDASLVCGRAHLGQAERLARRAMERGTNSARDLGLEVLLYASGERQLEKGLAKMGISPKTTRLAVCTVHAQSNSDESAGAADAASSLEKIGWTRDDTVLESSLQKLRRFGITEAEIETVGPTQAADLVLERVALVDALK